MVELTAGTQGIDVVGDLNDGKNGSTISVAKVDDSPSTVSTGIWFTDVAEIGAVGDQGEPTADSTVNLSARTPQFDTAVTSSSGDFWAASTNPQADVGVPVTIAPGETRSITLTITPDAPVGTQIAGNLYAYTTPSFAYSTFNTTGDVLAKVPYTYTVK